MSRIMLDIGYLKTIKILQPGLNNCPLHQVGIQDFGKCDSLFNYDCDSHFPGTLPRIARGSARVGQGLRYTTDRIAHRLAEWLYPM